MKISIAMATFNGARYLREQLDSIGRQSLLPTEVVISDDGSTDETVAIAREFAASAPFKVIIDAHAQRLGFTQNFVRAINRCTGEIVALCDQDDVWYGEKLAVATAPFADRSVSTVTHKVQVVDEHLKPTGLVMPECSYQGSYSAFNIDPWFSPNGMQLLFRRMRISPWLGVEPPLSAYGFGTAPFDEWIFFLGTLTGTAVLLDDVLGLWRRHGSAITRNVAGIKADSDAAHHLQLALHSGKEAYAFRAEITDARAEFADRSDVTSDGILLKADEGTAEFYREMSRMFRRRMELHDSYANRRRRLRLFTKMIGKNDYRSRDLGGLGRKAALKDGFTVLFGPREPIKRTAENNHLK